MYDSHYRYKTYRDQALTTKREDEPVHSPLLEAPSLYVEAPEEHLVHELTSSPILYVPRGHFTQVESATLKVPAGHFTGDRRERENEV